MFNSVDDQHKQIVEDVKKQFQEIYFPKKQPIYTDYEKINPLAEIKHLVSINPNDTQLGQKIRKLINDYYNE